MYDHYLTVINVIRKNNHDSFENLEYLEMKLHRQMLIREKVELQLYSNLDDFLFIRVLRLKFYYFLVFNITNLLHDIQ